MQISVKFVNLVIISLIYVSVIESQSFPIRGNGLPIDDLVAAIASAAMNGVIPLHKMNLGNRNPNRKGDAPLRIPILLIRPNDLRSLTKGKKSSNDRPFSGNINRRGHRNGRDHFKKDYSPKPKFPTQGMKVIPAPKNLEFEKSNHKKNFDKKPIMHFNHNRMNDREIPREIEEFAHRYVDKLNGNDNPNNNYNIHNHNNHKNKEMGHFKHRMNEERDNRNRLNKFRPVDEEMPPIRQSDRWKSQQENKPNTYELPEKDPERPLTDEDYDQEPLPPLKPVVKVPTVIRHVYGANPPLDNEKPTIPPRYLKSIAEIPSSSGSNPEKYDDREDDRQYPNEGRPLSKLQPLHEERDNYKTERLVTHKYVDLGDVYRKGSEQGEDDLDVQYDQGQRDYGDQGGQRDQGDQGGSRDQGDQNDQDEGPLAGYGKDPYDKQLISTLTKLMATSKNRHPLNIGGITGEEESKQSAKPLSKTSKFFTPSKDNGGGGGGGVKTTSSKSSLFDDLFGKPSTSSSYKSSSSNIQPQLTTGHIQYSSPQPQSSSQSRIPESLLTSFSSLSSSSNHNSGSQGSVIKEILSTANSNNNKGLVPLAPNQVPVVSPLTRKPVFLPLDYSTNDRPISSGQLFDDAIDEYGPTKAQA